MDNEVPADIIKRTVGHSVDVDRTRPLAGMKASTSNNVALFPFLEPMATYPSRKACGYALVNEIPIGVFVLCLVETLCARQTRKM